MGVLHGRATDGTLRSLLGMLRYADTACRRHGARQYVRFWLPPVAVTFKAAPGMLPAVVPELDGRPPHWRTFTDLADDLRKLDGALRERGKRAMVAVLLPMPRARRKTEPTNQPTLPYEWQETRRGRS